MSIMTEGATFVRDMKVGKIYIMNMGEVQIDRQGRVWFYNTSTINVNGCPAGAITRIYPDSSSLVYEVREVSCD